MTKLDKTLSEIKKIGNVHIPDAIQIATARATGCDAFLTNDINLKHIEDLSVLILDDFRYSE